MVLLIKIYFLAQKSKLVYFQEEIGCSTPEKCKEYCGSEVSIFFYLILLFLNLYGDSKIVNFKGGMLEYRVSEANNRHDASWSQRPYGCSNDGRFNVFSHICI